MNPIIKEKREILQTLSHTAKELAANEGLIVEEFTINDLLMNFIYNPDKDYIFKSFATWKKEGYTIKKGSKAYLLWGQPIGANKEDNTKDNAANNDDQEQKGTFFPLAYLFRNDQAIKPIKTKQKKPPLPKTKQVVDLPL